MRKLLIVALALGLGACETAPGKGIDARGGVLASLGKGPLPPDAPVGLPPPAISARPAAPDFPAPQPPARPQPQGH